MKKLSVSIVGNGSIGMMAAILLKKEAPNCEVTIFGRPGRDYSASTAAGAMANVYAELEAAPASQLLGEHRLFEAGIKGSEGWRKFLESSGGESVMTAEDTLLVLKKDAYDFERKNYAAVADKVIEDRIGSIEPNKSIEYFTGSRHLLYESVLRIRGEFAVDTERLFVHLDKLCDELGIRQSGELVSALDPSSTSIETESGAWVKSDFVIVAAGANTASLFPAETPIMSMFQGVGTALLVESAPPGTAIPKEVIRTVNRGGAQCGVHLVPRGLNGLYVGAGNTVTSVGVPQVRFETIRYLHSTAEREFFGQESAYHFSGSVKLGLRPRSLDGYPLIGPLKSAPTVFVATGTNRVGLTWAPRIASAIVDWVTNQRADETFEGWGPDRSPLSYASAEEALDFFTESRVGAAFEHGLVDNNSENLARKRKEIRQAGLALLDRLPSGQREPIPHPDNWAVVADHVK
jgi:glycine/D-amino acid oxidase-like deaminating enzyme